MRDSQKVLEKAIKSKEYFRLLDNYSLPANKRGKFNNVLKYNVSLEINKGIQVNEIENKVFMVAEELLNNKEFMTKLVSSDDTDTLLALGMMSNGLDKMF